MLNRLLEWLRPGAPPSALVTVYLREGRILVQHSDRTPRRTAGFWIGGSPVMSVDAMTDAASVGQVVLDALARSRMDVPVPERGADLEAPLRKAAGVTSHRAFMGGTRACWVNREKGTLRVEPLSNGGASGDQRGFAPMGEADARTLDATATPDAVGREVLAALARATSSPNVSSR